MKKTALLILAILLTLSLFACGKNAPPTEPDSSSELNNTMIATEPWPDNQFTQNLPKPEITILLAGTIGDTGFSVTFDDPTPDTVKAYAEQLKQAGYSEGTYEDGNEEAYTYSAKNAAGYYVMLHWAPGASGMLVTID